MAATDLTFAANLRRFRISAGLTQVALARKARLSHGTIAFLEQGLYDPAWSTVKKLSRAFGVKVVAFTEPADTSNVGPGRGSNHRIKRGPRGPHKGNVGRNAR